jgi:hypothetical protein
MSESLSANSANIEATLHVLAITPNELRDTHKTTISTMKGLGLLASLLAISYGHTSETVFSVNDDVLAYPQVWHKHTHNMSSIDPF